MRGRARVFAHGQQLSIAMDKQHFLGYNQHFDGTARRTIDFAAQHVGWLCLCAAKSHSHTGTSRCPCLGLGSVF
jgi:hypothetical protein